MLGPPIDPAVAGTRSARVPELVAGWWTSEVSGTGVVVPDGAIDVMWCPEVGPWVAGPDTAPRPTGLPAGTRRVVGVRLRVGVAAAVVDEDVDRIADRSVPLAEVWGRAEVERLDDELGRARCPGRAAGRLAAAIARHVPVDWATDALVATTVRDLRRGRPVDTGSLSRRQFRRRFVRSMGYGPAFHRRVVRLDRFTELRARTLVGRWPSWRPRPATPTSPTCGGTARP